MKKIQIKMALLLIMIMGAYQMKAVPSNYPDFTVAVTDNNCPSDENGQITITLDLAVDFTIEYSIDGGISWSSSNTFSNLASGEYLIKYRETGTTESSEMKVTHITWSNMDTPPMLVSTYENNASSSFFKAIHGNYAAASAEYFDNNGNIERQVYIHDRDAGGLNNWGAVDTIDNPDPSTFWDIFGSSISIYGDYMAIGILNTVDDKKEDVLIYKKGLAGPNQWGLLTGVSASDGDDNDRYGAYVQMDGEYLYVGARGDDVEGYGAGAVYIYKKDEGGIDNWGEVKILRSPTPGVNASFGSRIASYGDRLVVTAPSDPLTAIKGGAAYVFYKDLGGDENWGYATRLTASDARASLYFAESIETIGDFIFVGTRRRDGDRGGVYVFSKNAGGSDNWGEVKILTASDSNTRDRFGLDIEAVDDKLYITRQGYRPDGSLGGIYLFEKDQGGVDNWGEKAILYSPDFRVNEHFQIVYAYGDDLLVSAFTNSGASRAFFFQHFCCEADAGDLQYPIGVNGPIEICEGTDLEHSFTTSYSAADESEPDFSTGYATLFFLLDANGSIQLISDENGDFDYSGLTAGSYTVYALHYNLGLGIPSAEEYLTAIMNNPDANDIAELDYGINVSGICMDYDYHDAAGNSLQIVVKEAPLLSIEQSDAPALCQGNDLLLQAVVANSDDLPQPLTYLWNDNSTEASLSVDPPGTYSLIVTTASGCTAEASINLNATDATDYITNYTLLTSNGILLTNNIVAEGGIGVSAAEGKINLMGGTTITGANTFAKAMNISAEEGSQVNTMINEIADVPMPTFHYNPNDNLNTLVIPDGSIQTLTANNYGHITVGEGATLIFSDQSEIYTNGINVMPNATVQFMQCTNWMDNGKMIFQKNAQINPTEEQVSIYAEGKVKGNAGIQINASIYSLDDLQIKNTSLDNPAYMKGLFIANFIEAEAGVEWTQRTTCTPCNVAAVPPAPISIPATDLVNASSSQGPMSIWALYPNPSSGELTIQLPLIEQQSQLTIFDMMGRMVWEEMVAAGQTTLEVNLFGHRFKNGIYLVQLSNDQMKTSKRLMLLK